MILGMIKAILGAPARIAALEAKIAELEAALAAAKLTNSLSLVSPDGTKKIELLCQNHTAGIWVSGGSGKPMVAIYNDDNQGAVVGIWGQSDKDGLRRGGLDVSMSHCPTSGGMIQMISPNNTLYDIVPGSVGLGTHLENHTKF